MRDNKIKIVFSLIGGSLLICVHYLGTLLFYIAGLLIPLVYLISVFSAMYYAKKREVPLTFARLFKINLAVSFGMVVINFLFLAIGVLMISSIKEGILVFLFNLGVALLISGVCAYLFVKIWGNISRQ